MARKTRSRSKNTVVLTPFRIRVKKRREEEYFPLNKLPGGQWFFHVFRQFINAGMQSQPVIEERSDGAEDTAKTIDVDRDEQTAVKILDTKQYSPHLQAPSAWVDVFFESGEFGKGGTLLNVDTHATIKKGRNVADLLPFYARVDVRCDCDVGLLVVQEYGRPTVATTLKKRLSDFFHDNPDYEDAILRFESIVPHSYLKALSKGHLKKIRFTRKLLPTDTMDQLKSNGGKDLQGSLEISINSPRGSWFDVNDFIGLFTKESAGWSKFVAIDNDQDYDNVKLQIEYGGKHRTLDLGRDSGPLPYVRVDITDDVKSDADGHPTQDSIRDAVEQYMSNLHADENWI